MKLLLQEGASVDSRDAKKRARLHLAAQGGHVDVIQTLVVNAADIMEKAEYGSTAVQDAQIFSQAVTCSFLQQYIRDV